VRRLHDTEDAHIYVTGSSSTCCRGNRNRPSGRSVSFEVFPLSFPSSSRFAVRPSALLAVVGGENAAALDEYLATGGLPEVVLADEDLRQRILKEYVDLVFYKDLVERYRVGNPLVMRQLLRHCWRAPPRSSMRTSSIRTSGRRASRSRRHPLRLRRPPEESFVVFMLSVAERSVRKQAMNPKKLHAIDWALALPFVAAAAVDAGRKLESAVFLHWRAGGGPWVPRRRTEVDLCEPGPSGSAHQRGVLDRLATDVES